MDHTVDPRARLSSLIVVMVRVPDHQVSLEDRVSREVSLAVHQAVQVQLAV